MDGEVVVDADAVLDCDELFEEEVVARTERLILFDPDVVRDRRDDGVLRRDGRLVTEMRDEPEIDRVVEDDRDD
jgi:hypothetical protein